MPSVKMGDKRGDSTVVLRIVDAAGSSITLVTNVNISKSKPSYQHLLYSIYLPSITKIIFNRAIHPKGYSFAPSEGFSFFFHCRKI